MTVKNTAKENMQYLEGWESGGVYNSSPFCSVFFCRRLSSVHVATIIIPLHAGTPLSASHMAILAPPSSGSALTLASLAMCHLVAGGPERRHASDYGRIEAPT